MHGGHRLRVQTGREADVKSKMKIEVKTHSDSEYSPSDTVAEPLAPKQGPLLEQRTEQQTKTKSREKSTCSGTVQKKSARSAMKSANAS